MDAAFTLYWTPDVCVTPHVTKCYPIDPKWGCFGATIFVDLQLHSKNITKPNITRPSKYTNVFSAKAKAWIVSANKFNNNQDSLLYHIQ